MFVIFALLGMMLGLRVLEADGGDGADPLTLATIGFVILASFAVAELLAKRSVPKVIGYIGTGLLLGPVAGLALGDEARVLSKEVVAEMTMFNNLAVGLIALTAGLELELKAMARLARTLLTTVGAKVLIAGPLVGAALVAVELTFHPLGAEGTDTAMALGLVFGALAIGTSPAIALAIISESHAKGRLSELVLGAAVLKDLVVVVVLAMAVAGANSLLGGGGFEATVFVHVAEEIGIGAALGALLIAYLRWIKAEMLLFVAAMVLVVVELTQALHLDSFLLVFIAAGFVVRNFSKYEHDLLHPLEMVSLPVFVIFFTIAGAKVDLVATAAVLPMALVLFTVRGGGFWLAARIGNKLGREEAAVSANAWYAYLPQAGVTLGLVGLAAQQLESLSEPITNLGMAVVTLNLFAGPVALRKALGKAGELPESAAEGESASDAEGGAEADAPAGPGTREATRDVVLDELDPRLQTRVQTLSGELARALEARVREQVEPWLALRRRALAGLDPSSTEALVTLAEAPPRSDTMALANGLAVAFEAGAKLLQHVETSDAVAIEARALAPTPGEGAATKTRRIFRKLAKAVGSRRAARRQLPLRLIAREAFEPRMATALLELFRHSCHTDARLAEAMRQRLCGDIEAEDLPETLDAILDDFGTAAKSLLAGSLTAGSRRMHQLLARIDSPAMPTNRLDFSQAAAGIERELAALLAEAEAWPPVVDGCWQTVAVTARIRSLDTRLAEGRKVGGNIDEARRAVDEELSAFERRLQELREDLDERLRDPEQGEAGLLDDAALDSLKTRCRGLLPKPAIRRLRQVEAKLRRASAGRQIRQGLREAFSRETGPRLLAATELVARAAIPSRVRPREVDVRELVDGEVAGRMLPLTERKTEAAARQIIEIQHTTHAMIGDVERLLEIYRGALGGASGAAGEEDVLDNLLAGLDRVCARLGELREGETKQLAALAASVEAEFDGLDARLTAALDEATGTSDAARWVSRQRDLARQQVGRSLVQVREQATALWARIRERGGALLATLRRDYELRSGLTLPSATAIAEMIANQDELPLPRDYRVLFSAQPIRDPRFFVVNREPLRQVLRAERAWLQSEGGNALLLVGGPGTGKTSLLNVASLKLGSRELLWPQTDEPGSRKGVVATLAGELRCELDEAAVLARLGERQRVVILDDLERILPLGAAAIEALEHLLRLVAQTESTCFWLLAVGRPLQRLVEPLSPLRVGLAEVVELGRGDPEELAKLLLSRHRVSHRDLIFPQPPMRRLVSRLPFVTAGSTQSQETAFFHSLEAATGGNLRAAMFEWCRRARFEDEDLVLTRGLRGLSLPFVRQLPPTALAVLALIVSFGPCTGETLARALTCEHDALRRWIHFLLTAGLLVRDEADRLSCPPRVRDRLVPELIELAVLSDAP
nr:cation:proton antiporter [Pseudenhygromyxa sp. WMMC2535]